jgi:hypothetical protein
MLITKNRLKLIAVISFMAFVSLFVTHNAIAVQNTTNGIYTIYLEDDVSANPGGPGTFALGTGASHPSPNENILFGGDGLAAPTNSWITIRSYTSLTNYTSTNAPISSTPPFSTDLLRNYSPTVSSITPPGGGTGFQTTWTITGKDSLTVEQYVVIRGSTLEDSNVTMRTVVTNNDSSPVDIGIRYLLDSKISNSDDSRIKQLNPDSPIFTSTFFEVPPATPFEYYEMTNDVGTFSIFGTVTGPTTLVPPPTPPDRFNYSWRAFANSSPWTFTVSDSDKDSALCYFWGDDVTAAPITLSPTGTSGDSIEVVQYVSTSEESLEPVIIIDKKELSYGCTNVGEESFPQTVTVTNNGLTDLNVNTIAIQAGSDSDQFDIRNDTCSNTTIPASGGVCTFDVVFTPISLGTKNAIVEIPNDLATKLISLEGLADACPTAIENLMCYKVRPSKGNICDNNAPVNAGGACETEEDCGGTTDVTEFCNRNTFDRSVVSLKDQFVDTKYFNVLKPERLCNPATLDDMPPLTIPPNMRNYNIRRVKKSCIDSAPANPILPCTVEEDCGGVSKQTSYCQLTPRFDRKSFTNIRVDNKFSDDAGIPYFIDIVRPETLMVPSNIDQNNPVDPPDPALLTVDHFACYIVRAKRRICNNDPSIKCRRDDECAAVGGTCNLGVPIRQEVTLEDEFGEKTLYIVRKPRRFCLPASKNGEPILDSAGHLLCYRMVKAINACVAGSPVNEFGKCKSELDCGGERKVTSYCQVQSRHTKIRGLHMSNQLDRERIDTIVPLEVCLPSTKTLP